MDAKKIMQRVQFIIVCGLLAGALASAIPGQRAMAEPLPTGLSCRAPRNEAERAQCATFERQILDATVLLDFTMACGDHGMPHVPSHATIMDERTLLTHDHFYPFAEPGCAVATLELWSVRGDLHLVIRDADWLAHLARQLQPGPVEQSRQTRQVSFPAALFTPAAGLQFARFADLPSADEVNAWGEVADVNWQGLAGTTRVQWVQPRFVERRDAALGLVIDVAVEVGASGGGAFRVTPAGLVHVGNIWGTWHEDDATIIALNPMALGR